MNEKSKKNLKKSLKLTTLGFTLVELLAVIVILAIILVIAVPKVMSIIEDAKMGTLESTAKMIASAAEKQKVQNTVLGNDKEITCDSVAKINKGDYASCNITFDNNTAKVTIEGSGKFDGLYVCGGTKTDAKATDEECGENTNTATSYLESLLVDEATLQNGLVRTATEYNGITYDTGLRYISNGDYESKNNVYYNCEETDNSGVVYGSDNYDYANSCEVWEIVGVFDTKSSISGNAEARIKLVNTKSSFSAIWDSNMPASNRGNGINQWGESGDYKGADLMQLLNGYYIGKEGTTCTYYYTQFNDEYYDEEGTCTTDSLKESNMKPLTNVAKGMIENAVWDTYAVITDFERPGDLTAAGRLYLQEKGISNQYTGISECSEDDECNDTITRTTSWTGLVGLLSVSDVMYSGGETGISFINPTPYGYIYALDWTPRGDFIQSKYTNSTWEGDHSYGVVKPVVYLKANVKIISGNGDTEPYVLAI